MNTASSALRRHALASFCALTLALSFAAALLPAPPDVIPVVMVFIPALMAVALTALSEGGAGVRALLGRLAQPRLSPGWVLVALAMGLAMRLAISLIALGLGWIPTLHLRPGPPAQLVLLAVILFVFAIPEELGWRGFALPRLLRQHSPLAAGLIVGGLWGSLHLALHLPGLMYAGLPLLATLLQLVGLSLLLAWLYVRSGGSVLLASLFHAAQSFFVIVNEGIPLERQAWLMAGVYLAFALMVFAAGGPDLVRAPAVQPEAHRRSRPAPAIEREP